VVAFGSDGGKDDVSWDVNFFMDICKLKHNVNVMVEKVTTNIKEMLCEHNKVKAYSMSLFVTFIMIANSYELFK
jgi:hypothetical protein